ncbi:MAG: dephospho-CoA kinase [Spirochaetaceae bacterium]
MPEKTVLGLTGKSCSGKDEAAKILAERGWEIIDVDSLGHQALVQRKADIVQRFGERVLGSSGEVDRRRLGKIVFADSRELHDLEAIVHPEMRQKVKELIESGTGQRKICINAALLFYMKLHLECDGVILVTAPLVLRFIRAKKRDRLPALHILRRFAGQRTLFPKHLQKDVDMYIVRNCGSRMRLKKRLETKLGEYGLINEKTVG